MRENMTFGAAYPAEAVNEAMRIFGVESVLDALAQGLATVISERGFNLSGGQRQRLALARGVARRA